MSLLALPPRFAETFRVLLSPTTIPRREIVNRLDEVLVGSLFLVALSVGAVGAAMCDQAAAQALRLIGDLTFIGPEYITLGFEAYGPLVLSAAFAARVGAGFAAEVALLGSEETLDALDLCGAEPSRTLLAPMGIACAVGAVCLGFLGAVAWEVTGIVTMWVRFGQNPLTFFRPDALGMSAAVLCFAKALTFGGIVFTAALFAGLRAKSGADEVGAATTHAVVASVLLCIAANLAIDIFWRAVASGPT